jgi:hypothetical protein
VNIVLQKIIAPRLELQRKADNADAAKWSADERQHKRERQEQAELLPRTKHAATEQRRQEAEHDEARLELECQNGASKEMATRADKRRRAKEWKRALAALKKRCRQQCSSKFICKFLPGGLVLAVLVVLAAIVLANAVAGSFTSTFGARLLRGAAYRGTLDETRQLLKLGADPDGIDATAPMLASEQGHAVMVEPLLSNGANVAQLPHNGLSGDDLTAQHGRADFSPRLIENTINYRSLLYLYDEE